MLSFYKVKIISELDQIPEGKAEKLFRIIHILIDEFKSGKKETKNRGSLKGIWKGSHIDESIFDEAKKSLFPYERNK